VTDYRGVVDGYLLSEVGDKPIEAITPDMIDHYKEKLITERRLSNRVIVRHVTVLHGVFKPGEQTNRPAPSARAYSLRGWSDLALWCSGSPLARAALVAALVLAGRAIRAGRRVARIATLTAVAAACVAVLLLGRRRRIAVVTGRCDPRGCNGERHNRRCRHGRHFRVSFIARSLRLAGPGANPELSLCDCNARTCSVLTSVGPVGKIRATHITQGEPISEDDQVAGQEQSELVVHGEDGRVRENDSRRQHPRNIRRLANIHDLGGGAGSLLAPKLRPATSRVDPRSCRRQVAHLRQ
jgi:hypothetical protein